MPERLLRPKVWQSDRILDLPTDTHRLVFFRLLSEVDDFGNIEGGGRKLFRMLVQCTQIKSDDQCTKIMHDLADADIVRRYEVDGREFWHLCRLQAHRQYLVRKCPPSPWCNPDVELGKSKKVINQDLAKNLATKSQQDSNEIVAIPQPPADDMTVGVGVVVGVKEEPNQNQVPVVNPETHLRASAQDTPQPPPTDFPFKPERLPPATGQPDVDHSRLGYLSGEISRTGIQCSPSQIMANPKWRGVLLLYDDAAILAAAREAKRRRDNAKPGSVRHDLNYLIPILQDGAKNARPQRADPAGVIIERIKARQAGGDEMGRAPDDPLPDALPRLVR